MCRDVHCVEVGYLEEVTVVLRRSRLVGSFDAALALARRRGRGLGRTRGNGSRRTCRVGDATTNTSSGSRLGCRCSLSGIGRVHSRRSGGVYESDGASQEAGERLQPKWRFYMSKECANHARTTVVPRLVPRVPRRQKAETFDGRQLEGERRRGSRTNSRRKNHRVNSDVYSRPSTSLFMRIEVQYILRR